MRAAGNGRPPRPTWGGRPLIVPISDSPHGGGDRGLDGFALAAAGRAALVDEAVGEQGRGAV